jgi:hypothetical protein
MFPLGAIFLGSHLLVSVADGVPRLDVNKTCQLEAMNGGAISQDITACLNDEQSARDEIMKQWAKFSAADRLICVNMATRGYLPGYVELLTCLEMFQYSKTLPEEQAQRPKGPRK